MVKCTGAEWKAFYSNNEYWPEGYWHDDVLVSINGQESDDFLDADVDTVADDAVIRIEAGHVFEEDGEPVRSLEAHFKKWKKEATTVMLVVQVDRKKADDVKAAIKAAGGKIVK